MSYAESLAAIEKAAGDAPKQPAYEPAPGRGQAAQRKPAAEATERPAH
jgi:hypothetical protein